MVMRPFTNITKQKSTFTFSRNVSTNSSYTHQFFNPSYLSPKELIKVDEIGFNSNKNNKTNRSILKYVTPALSVTKNYVIFNSYSTNENDNNNNSNNNNSINNYEYFDKKDFDKILLRKLNHKGNNNKNSHLNISIESINSNFTVLNIRRANSNNIRKISIPNSNNTSSKRFYSTENLEDDLKTLKIEEKVEEKVEEKILKNENHVKFQQLNDQSNYNFDSIDDCLDTFLYDNNNSIKSQEVIIDSLNSLGKFNEILPIFIRMRNNNLIPTIEIYNKVLKSIQFRETDESIEINLTHLLNIYSDMLTNNLKPNNQTYELVIDSLTKGSIKSYKNLNFKSGYEFFKIALELFLINEKNNSNLNFKKNSIYIDLLNCLNYYKITDMIKPNDLLNLLIDKIQSRNLIEFYIQIIKFSSLFKDLQFIEYLYNNQIKNLNLQNHHHINTHKVYQSIIEAYNLCNEFNKSSLLLDSIINNLPNKDSIETKNLISNYLSIYIKSQSLTNPNQAFKTLVKFNSLTWLPNLNIESLIILSNSFLKLNDLKMSIKIWDFIIIRSDFDFQFKNLFNDQNTNEYSILISNCYNQLFQSVLNSNDKDLILKFSREFLCKNSLSLNDVQFINLINFLRNFDNNDNNELIFKLILNQGYKKIINNTGNKTNQLNNYLSLIVDFITTQESIQLFNSKFFKKVIEEYRLINDNIYGILKIFNSIESQIFNNDDNNKDSNILLNLKYYSKVLDYEFNDVDNCYVNLPNEIIQFKKKISNFIDL